MECEVVAGVKDIVFVLVTLSFLGANFSQLAYYYYQGVIYHSLLLLTTTKQLIKSFNFFYVFSGYEIQVSMRIKFTDHFCELTITTSYLL